MAGVTHLGSRRGDPVVPRLPEPPQSENDFGDEVRGYRLGVSWPRKQVIRSIERHGIGTTRTTLQGLNCPEELVNAMFIELGVNLSSLPGGRPRESS